MQSIATLLALIILFIFSACDTNRGTSRCATDLNYETNPFTAGEEAIRHASVYSTNLFVGNDDFVVKAIVDTASANLVINEKAYDKGFATSLGTKNFAFNNGHERGMAIHAKDSIDLTCMENLDTFFALTSKESDGDNYLGLAYNDSLRHGHEAKTPSFFNQLIKNGFDDSFSLALCGAQGNSSILFGGVHDTMRYLIGNYIPIMEKSAYVIPALTLRRADNKYEIGDFPFYDAKKKTGLRTIIDSASSFVLLPPFMAESVSRILEQRAESLGIRGQLPSGFFRTERANSVKTVRFHSLAQIRQFPSLEITFLGADGKTKALELSPLYYFKGINKNDPLERIFAIRETSSDIILGQPFLENHYTYFDRENSRIGFGNIDMACHR